MVKSLYQQADKFSRITTGSMFAVISAYWYNLNGFTNNGGNKMSRIVELKDKFKSEFMDPDSVKKFVRYLVVGVTTFIIEYSLFLFFREILPLHELVTNIIIYTFIFWFNFLMNKFFTFKSRKNIVRQLISYGLLFLFNGVVGNILLFTAIKKLLEYIFPTVAWIPYYLPKILIMVFIVSWNFILYKKVIYNE